MSQLNYFLRSFAGQYVPTPLQLSKHAQLTSTILEPVDIRWKIKPNLYIVRDQPNSA